MQESGRYRTIDRRIFAILMVVLVAVVSAAAWLGLDRLAAYFMALEDLAGTDPRAAAASLSRLVRTIAVLNLVVLSSLAALVIHHAWKGLRTACMPPQGSWILEGQRTWSGKPAVRIARFVLAAGTLLVLLAFAGSLVLWSLSETLDDPSPPQQQEQ